MRDRHRAFWPPWAPPSLVLPETSVFENLAVSARRYPDKPAILYYGGSLTYRRLLAEVEAVAGWLQQVAGVAQGDRVLLYLQNAPQFVIGYYAALRADAIVVPVNPMNRRGELEHLLADTGAKAAVVAQDLLEHLAPLLEAGRLPRALVACYADYADADAGPPLPEAVAAPRRPLEAANAVAWHDALAAAHAPGLHRATAADPALICYSSGTTGRPKGCLHSHRSVSATLWGSLAWNPAQASSVALATLPYFHVTGMQNSMNALLCAGATIVLMSRWDRRLAADLIERHRVTHWRSITTMAVDFLCDPDVATRDLSSLTAIGGGGAQMPKAIAEKLKRLTGLDYVEGYGLTETCAGTHINPPQRAKPQCLGIPVFDVDSRLLDPETLRELGPGEVGEIVVSAPQVFLGYWNAPEADAAAFLEIDGKRFFRTGDLGTYDEEGYWFLRDRLKRMINASGFKVWPAEVEALLYDHPEVVEACVVSAPDARRGETVKALVVRRRGSELDAETLSGWCRERMAAYKVPRIVAFVDSLPRSGAGKVLWRQIQEAEWAAPATTPGE